MLEKKAVSNAAGRNQHSEVGGRFVHLPQKTREKLAQEFCVSDRTITRDAVFAQAVDTIGVRSETLKRQAFSGKLPKEDVIRLATDPQKLEQAARGNITLGEIADKLEADKLEGKRRSFDKSLDLLIRELGDKLDQHHTTHWRLTPLEWGERFHAEDQQANERREFPIDHRRHIEAIAEFCRGYLAREAKVKMLAKNA